MHRCCGLRCFYYFFFFDHHIWGHLNQTVNLAVKSRQKDCYQMCAGFLVSFHHCSNARCHVHVTAVAVRMASGVSYVLAMCDRNSGFFVSCLWMSLSHTAGLVLKKEEITRIARLYIWEYAGSTLNNTGIKVVCYSRLAMPGTVQNKLLYVLQLQPTFKGPFYRCCFLMSSHHVELPNG